MNMSYSLHLSNKNKLSNKRNVLRAFMHNLRSYSSNEYDKNKNVVLLGPQNATEAMKLFEEKYLELFLEDVYEYNKTKTKNRDKIFDYLEHVSNDKKKDVAAEMIIQVGAKDQWDNFTLEDKQKMTPFFQKQLDELQKLCPNFKIVSAVIHYDEASPHMQIIGIPIAKYEKGLKTRVAKTNVFTKESLRMLQDKMRENIEQDVSQILNTDVKLISKSEGRNKDLTIKEYSQAMKELEKIQAKIKEEESKLNEIKSSKDFKLLNRFDEIKKKTKKKEKSILRSETTVEMSENDYNDLLEMSKKNVNVYNDNIALAKQLKANKKENEELKERAKNYDALYQKHSLLKDKHNKLIDNLNEAFKYIEDVFLKNMPDLKQAFKSIIKIHTSDDNSYKKKDNLEKLENKYGIKKEKDNSKDFER